MVVGGVFSATTWLALGTFELTLLTSRTVFGAPYEPSTSCSVGSHSVGVGCAAAFISMRQHFFKPPDELKNVKDFEALKAALRRLPLRHYAINIGGSAALAGVVAGACLAQWPMRRTEEEEDEVSAAQSDVELLATAMWSQSCSTAHSRGAL